MQDADYQLFTESVTHEMELAARKNKQKNVHASKEETTNILDRFGLAEYSERHPLSLSGGQKQRVTIAASIAAKSDILVLDEPTSGLDGRNMLRLKNILRELKKQGISTLVKDKTLIVIAHRLSTIRDAEQILVIDNGKLVQHGKHDELVLQEGIYQKYWNIRQNAKAWKVAQ